jgi:hypothetical protein
MRAITPSWSQLPGRFEKRRRWQTQSPHGRAGAAAQIAAPIVPVKRIAATAPLDPLPR